MNFDYKWLKARISAFSYFYTANPVKTGLRRWRGWEYKSGQLLYTVPHHQVYVDPDI